jgi:hypothetical protein
MNSAEFRRRARLRTRGEVPADAVLPLADVTKSHADRALVLEPPAGRAAGTRCVGRRAARQCAIVGTPMDIRLPERQRALTLGTDPKCGSREALWTLPS